MELTKEERDRRANVKMEEMKRKNEEYIGRFKEIEADKANADRMSSSVVVEPAKPYVMRARTPRAQPQSTSQAGAPPPPLLALPVMAGPPPQPERGGPPPDPVYRFLSDPDRDGDDAAFPQQQQQHQMTPPRSSNRGGDQQDRWRGGAGSSGGGSGGNAGRGSNWTTPRGSGRERDSRRRGGRGRGNREDRSFGGVDSSYDQRNEVSPRQFNQRVDGTAADVGPLTPGSSGMWHNSGFNESLANMSAVYGYPEPLPEASNRMGLPSSAGLSSTPNAIAPQSDITNEGLVPDDFKLSGDLASRLNSRDIRLEPQSSTDDLNNQFQTGRDGGRGGGGGFNRSHVDWRQPQEDGMNANYSATIDPNGNGGPPFIDSSDLRHSLTRNGGDNSWNRGGDSSGAYNVMDGGLNKQAWGPDRGGGGGHNRSWHEGRGGGRGGGGRDSRGGRQDGRRGERGGGRRPGRGRGYDKWKAERDAIDEQRIQRARAGDGGWRRAWDNEKIKQGEGEDSEPVYDPRFPPSMSEGVQLGEFLAASPSVALSLQQQHSPPETSTQDPSKSPECTPNDPLVLPAPSTDVRRGGVKSGHTNRNEIRGRGRKDRHAKQVRAANMLRTSASAGAAGQDTSPLAGYSGSWCVDANQEPVRDVSQEPITSEVLVDPKTRLVGSDADTNKSQHPDGSGLNEITKMVEQMVTQERHKQDLKKYTQQTSIVSDIGAEGFGFGEDCLAAEWYDSGSRMEMEARRQAVEGRREGGKNKRDLWVVKDAAPHSSGSSKEGSPTDGASQESSAAPGPSFEELLQQHRSVQHEMYGTADEDDHHRQGRRSSGKTSRKDGRVTKRAVRRNQLSAAETILEDPTAADSTVTDMNKVSAALEALIIEKGSGTTESRPPLDGSWNEGQARVGVIEAVDMRNGKKNPALETLEEDFLNKLKDVDARAESLCGLPVATKQTTYKGASGSLNDMTEETETCTRNHVESGMYDCEQPTPAVHVESLLGDLSSSPKVVSTSEGIPPAALVPLPDEDDFSQLEGSKDVVNDQVESSPKDVGDFTKPNDKGSASSPLMVGPDDSSVSTTNDFESIQQTVGDLETLSLTAPLTSSAAREKFTASRKFVDMEAEHKTSVVVTCTQLNDGATTTPVPVATHTAFHTSSTFSTTPAQVIEQE